MNFHMTIGKRFAVTAAAVLVLMAVQGIWALSVIRSLSKSVDVIVTDPLPGVQRASSVATALQTLRGNAWKHMTAADPALKAKTERESTAAAAEIASAMTEYERTIATEQDRALYSKIMPLIQRYEQVLESEVYPASRDMKMEQARDAYLRDADPNHRQALAAVNELIALNRKNGDTDSADAQSRAGSGQSSILIILSFAFAIGSAIAYMMVKSINRTLTGAVTELAQGADQIANAAQQVSSASQSLAQGSSEQAASLEETSSSGEEMNSMAQQNARNCTEAAGLVRESQTAFQRTEQALRQMTVAMAEINTSSDKIAKIIRVIDEIAFQTNILALNAAVEAARAGEAGMGFAVVADEVRNLAQRCAQAAKDTAGLIEESIGRANEGKVRTDVVTTEIQGLIGQSARVKSLVDSVNSAGAEQARGIEQVSKAIVQMSQVTQQTAATAQESAAAAEELSAQSESMQAVVAQLRALVTHTESGALQHQA